MIDLEEINEEINRLEKCDCTTYSVCEKLAILYTVRNNYSKPINPSNSTMKTMPSMIPVTPAI